MYILAVAFAPVIIRSLSLLPSLYLPRQNNDVRTTGIRETQTAGMQKRKTVRVSAFNLSHCVYGTRK